MKLWHIETNSSLMWCEAVVRAETEERARELAASHDDRLFDPSQSTCEEITVDGPETVIVSAEHE